MLYSRSNKLVFVHIQKTGGSSVRKILVPKLLDYEEVGFKHDLSKWHWQMLPDWNDCYKFCFVRNPWERLVSWYSMVMQKQSLLAQSQNKLWQYAITESKSFEEFVKKCTEEISDYGGRKSFAYNQIDYISDENGKILVDFIGRYENFSGDMRHVAHTLGIEEDVVPVHENRSKHRHYSSYYSEELKAIVADRYARDIEFFGYEFEYAPREVDQY